MASILAVGLDKDAFEKPLETMDVCWADPDMAKLGANSLIGLMAHDESANFSCITSQEEPRPGHFCKRTVFYQNGRTTDWIYQTKHLDNATLFPLHVQILCTEGVRVAQALYIIEKLGIPARCVSDIKTDCVRVADYAKKREPALKAIANVTFAELPYLRRKYEKCNVQQQFLDSRAEVSGRKGDEALVFKIEPAKRLVGNYNPPGRTAKAPEPPAQFTDISVSEALVCLLAGQSVSIFGAPGVGKSTLARELTAQLREAGKIVHAVAKTHSAVQNLAIEGATTLDYYVRRYTRLGSCPCDVLLVEELTQIEPSLWADLVRPMWLQNPDGGPRCTYLILGDFAQFPCVAGTWGGCPVPPHLLQASDMIRELAPNRVTLFENMRSDATIFGYITGLGILDRPRPLAEALAEAKLLFPKTRELPDFTLTMSHKRRVQINGIVNRARAKLQPHKKWIVCEPTGKEQNMPQSMWIWEGLTLIGAGGKTKRGLFYEIESICEEHVAMTDGAKLAFEDLVKHCRLSHAICFAGCQGLTLKGRVRLETDSPHLTLRHLYVGISRATGAPLVEVC